MNCARFFLLIGIGWGFLMMLACANNMADCLKTLPSSKISEQVVQGCEDALGDHPKRQDLLHQYVQLQRVRGNYEQIVQWCRKVLNDDPNRTDARYFLAYGLRKLGRYAEAIQEYQTYSQKNTDDPDPYFGIAICHEALSDYSAAISSYQIYLEKEKQEDKGIWKEKAQQRLVSLRSMSTVRSTPIKTRPSVEKSETKPIVVATPIVEQPKDEPSMNTASVPTQETVVQIDCSSYVRAISTNPFDVNAYDNFVLCAQKAGRYSEIVERMRTALRDNPEYTRGWVHLGNAHKAMGNTAAASDAFSKACAANVTEACGL